VTENAVLRVAGLTVRLDGEVILEDISFTVQEGGIVTILGPNGAGKTVLLRTLLGALPYEGSIVWKAGTRIGYVPQRLPYIREIPLGVRDFFGLKAGVTASVGEMLRDVGLPEEVAKKRVGDLSSGQFQRILIAWALAGNPQMLLFDEPTSGIDVSGEETVYELIRRVTRERNLTVLMITHDLAVVSELSTRVLCVNRTLVCQGPPLEVLNPDRLRELYGTEVKYYRHEHE